MGVDPRRLRVQYRVLNSWRGLWRWMGTPATGQLGGWRAGPPRICEGACLGSKSHRKGLDRGLCRNEELVNITQLVDEALLGHPRTRASACKPPSGRHPYAAPDADMPRLPAPTLMRTAEGQEPHGSALTAHLNQLHHPPSRPDSQGGRPQTRSQAHLPGATLGVRTRGSLRARKQRHQCGSPAKTPTSQRPGSPTARPRKGAQRCPPPVPAR